MNHINIDIETFSDVDLEKCGVYKYAESRNFKVLLFGYSVDGGEARVVDLAHGERIPKEIVDALSDKSVIKSAFNAQFERVCLSKYLAMKLPPESWHCTMVWCAEMGLPMSLANAGEVLGLNKKKLDSGKQLISYFCKPCENKSRQTAENWRLFKEYNKRDVEVEMEIQKRLEKFPVSESEWRNYVIDQNINDRGIAIDTAFVRQAVALGNSLKEKSLARAGEITGLQNPNSRGQMLEWLKSQGVEADSLDKDSVKGLLGNTQGNTHEVLLLRQDFSKSSVKKYDAMENVVCADGRARGLHQFYGASRTGRFAGRLIQVQNLPQNHIPNLSEVREHVKNGNASGIDSSVLSELIRTAFVPKDGCRFIVADYSAIEARILAWISGENWRTEVFNQGKDIYCASASQMFNVPVEKNGINGQLRQKGKIAELALGYGGSVGALKSMGALEMGLQENELTELVNRWRKSNPNIVKYWYSIEHAVKNTISTGSVNRVRNVSFALSKGILFAKLPSGRMLSYMKPRVANNSIVYCGVNSAKQWGDIESYGAKFVENIAQATARDILVEAMHRFSSLGFEIVMHVHDEVVIEVPVSKSSVDEVCEIMAQQPEWARACSH